MNISLPPALEKFVQDKVSSGQFSTASEVVRDGLRLLQEQDVIRKMRLEELRREVQIGIDEIERGEGIVYNSIEEFAEDVKKRGRERLAKMNAAKRAAKKGRK
ncbi:type II toxin-antitoxin system ParD family antitoxin [bacterium]|nr:type II toxin-antitoxin system ParD family antitoxin [bacterium]